MKKLLFISIISLSAIAMYHSVPQRISTDIRCVDVTPVRSTFNGQCWDSEFEDSRGNSWIVFMDERPDIREYTLVIDGNNTSILKDDVVLDVI